MAWAQIRGHDAARQQLLAAFNRGRLAHAYLFVGPDGVGKRLFATVFAKALVCEAPPGPLDACDRCPACLQVAVGTHPDVFTVKREEEKNELSVEVMRGFCHRLGLKSSRGRRKVGVIEEADEFNASSANAFLKPLEEPPPGSVIVLLATSADRQLPTILSRCQVIPFRPLPAAEMRAVLADHGVTDSAAADRLTRLAGGSPGRALALNDDALWAFRDTLLTAVTATKLDPFPLAERWVKFVEEAGKQAPAQRERASLVIQLLIGILRQALRVAVGGPAGGAEGDRLKVLANRVGPDRLAELLEECAEADYRVGRYVQVSLVIEGLVDQLGRAGSACP